MMNRCELLRQCGVPWLVLSREGSAERVTPMWMIEDMMETYGATSEQG